MKFSTLEDQISIVNGSISSGSKEAPIRLNEKVKISLIGSSREFHVDEYSGTLYKHTVPENTNTLAVFTNNSTDFVLGRLYYLKLFKEKNAALDLIPVSVGDVCYMYDRVSGKLFGNAGSGKFILGPDI